MKQLQLPVMATLGVKTQVADIDRGQVYWKWDLKEMRGHSILATFSMRILTSPKSMNCELLEKEVTNK